MSIRRHLALAVIAVLLAGCTQADDGQPKFWDSFPTAVSAPTVSSATGPTGTPRAPISIAPTSSGRGRTLTTISPRGDELPAHRDSESACTLLSWDALDARVRPQDTNTFYPWPITPSRNGSMECRIVNEDAKTDADEEARTKVVLVSVVVWRNMAMLDDKTADIEGHPATIAERKYQCTIVADVDLRNGRGRTKVGFAVTNDRFIEPGLEPCALTRQVATWTLRR